MKKIISLLTIFIIIFTVTGCFNKEKTDAMKFKEEYESINNEKTDSGKKYRELSIDKNNPTDTYRYPSKQTFRYLVRTPEGKLVTGYFPAYERPYSGHSEAAFFRH